MLRLLVVIALGAATASTAQPDPRTRLAAARAEAERATIRVRRLEAQAKASGDASERARVGRAAIAARIQAAEAAIGEAEARLALIDRLRRAREARLAARQQPIVRLTAALQTMSRRPAALTLLQPGSLDDMVRVRALLTSVEPRIRAQTSGLRAEMARARQLRVAAAFAVADLRKGQARARAEQRELARLEAMERQRSIRFASSARLEAQRATQIAEDSRDLESLVSGLDADAALRDRLAALPGPLPRPARLTAALPPADRSPQPIPLRFQLPALGPVVRGFGEALPSGARSRGIGIAARAGAIVVAPAAGRVTFAGLFRGYGAIAILDHGGSYTSLITGLGANLARVGEPVRQGSPIGRAGTGGVTVELRQGGRPVDMSQFVA